MVPMSQLWSLTQRWYHDRLNPSFRGRSLDTASEILRDTGLTGTFWQLGS